MVAGRLTAGSRARSERASQILNTSGSPQRATRLMSHKPASIRFYSRNECHLPAPCAVELASYRGRSATPSTCGRTGGGMAAPGLLLQAALRPYQQRGYAWLWRNARMGLGSVIADDMGLGRRCR